MTLRQRRLYREMVVSVRRWIAATHPNAYRLRVVDEDDFGCGVSLAAFHAESPEYPDEFTLGDPEASCRS